MSDNGSYVIYALAVGANIVRYSRYGPHGTTDQEGPHQARRVCAMVRQSRREDQSKAAHREGADGHRQEGGQGEVLEEGV